MVLSFGTATNAGICSLVLLPVLGQSSNALAQLFTRLLQVVDSQKPLSWRWFTSLPPVGWCANTTSRCNDYRQSRTIRQEMRRIELSAFDLKNVRFGPSKSVERFIAQQSVSDFINLRSNAMSMHVLGYATQSAEEKLGPFRFERREPRADDVVIEILYCGVCHSDLHQARNDWANSIYPMVPGHEIIGSVLSVGSSVTRFKPGDPVGVGCMVDSCQHCEPCRQGLEQYCEEFPTVTYNGMDRRDHTPTYGGYSEKIVVSRQIRTEGSRTDWMQQAPRLYSVQASRPGRRCVTGRSARAAKWRSSVWAASAIWR